MSILYERTFSKVYKLKIELDFSMRGGGAKKCEIFDVNSGNFSNAIVLRIRIFASEVVTR